MSSEKLSIGKEEEVKTTRPEKEEKQKTRVYLGLGSNMGNKKDNILKALFLLKEHPNIDVTKISTLIETDPVEYVEQDKFMNGAVEIETDMNPHDLLKFIHKIENDMGRIRGIINGPRIIDLDIFFYGNQLIRTTDLIVPHPRLHDRAFALDPLKEICPNFEHPVLKLPIRKLVPTK
jgi:dihydroneopterin aldolase / 2-amino-4-hydroxy-6-hydroxymethyldihydropteridine diphosphokinase